MITLKRTHQCKKCPWKQTVDPYEIPHGYDLERHRALSRTIAIPGSLNGLRGDMHVMACHEHASSERIYCVGWLMHQLGPGNNIPLRIAMMDCTNVQDIVLDGPQHECFEDTLP